MLQVDAHKLAKVVEAIGKTWAWERAAKVLTPDGITPMAGWILANHNLGRSMEDTAKRINSLCYMELKKIGERILDRDIDAIVKAGYEALDE